MCFVCLQCFLFLAVKRFHKHSKQQFGFCFGHVKSYSCLSPGDKLCSVEDCIPGTGVYLRHGYIYSSLAGYVLKKNEGEEVRGVSLAASLAK